MPGSRCASSEFRACGAGGAGPWRARKVSAPRFLLRLHGSGVKAGVWGRLRSALATCASREAAPAPPAPPWVQTARSDDSLSAFFKTRILRLLVVASGAERLRGGPMRAQSERLTEAVIGGGSGDMADRRWNQPMDTWRTENRREFSLYVFVGDAVSSTSSGVLWWKKESSTLET